MQRKNAKLDGQTAEMSCFEVFPLQQTAASGAARK